MKSIVKVKLMNICTPFSNSLHAVFNFIARRLQIHCTPFQIIARRHQCRWVVKDEYCSNIWSSSLICLSQYECTRMKWEPRSWAFASCYDSLHAVRNSLHAVWNSLHAVWKSLHAVSKVVESLSLAVQYHEMSQTSWNLSALSAMSMLVMTFK